MPVNSKYIFIAMVLVFTACGFPSAGTASNVGISLRIGCNGNGICEASNEENRLNCASDCPICDNSGVCDADWGETRTNCAADCSVCDRNGACDAGLGETEGNCIFDCPAVGCNNDGACQSSRGEDTDNCPADCPRRFHPGGDSGHNLNEPEILGIEVSDINLMSARISWDTDIPARCEVYFGNSSEYENGTVYETDFSRGRHSASINGLVPQNIYHFMISCLSASGASRQTNDWQFTTMSLPDTVPPANVSGFEAAAGENSIALGWVNPGDQDLVGVRILRAEKFFPKDLMTGQIIYEGRQTSFEDTDVVIGKTYYYTAFAYDRSGNYSSGAIASAIVGESGKEADIPAAEAPAEVQNLSLQQFDFTQNGREIEVKNGIISIDRFQPFIISLPYGDVPEVLKTIMVTLKEGGKSFSFLLRANKDKTDYEAIVVPPDAGDYALDITVLDYKNQALKKINAGLKVTKAVISEGQTEALVTKYITIRKFPPIIYIILAILALLAAKKIYHKIRKRREESVEVNY